MLRTPGTGCFDRSAITAGRTRAVMVTSTFVTPGTRETAAPASSPTFVRVDAPKIACSTVKATRPPSIVRSLMYFAATMSRSTMGSRTERSASRTAVSVGTSDLVGGDLPDEREFEFLALIRLEHQVQPENGRCGNHEEEDD